MVGAGAYPDRRILLRPGPRRPRSQLVTDDIYHATLAASVITILLNGLLMRTLPKTAQQAG